MKRKSTDRKKRKAIITKFNKEAEPGVPALSVVPTMTVFNEVNRLKIWLDEHKFHEQVIVIDQGSTDGTVDLIEAESKARKIKLVKNIRFEHFGEPDFKMLQKLAGNNACLITAPDEFIPEKMFREIERRVNKSYRVHRTRAFYIARKNMMEGKCINDMFVTGLDPDGKDWQLRISIGGVIEFQNTPHTHAKAKAEWAYLADDVFIEHRKTLEEERESQKKRANNLCAQAVGRDTGFMADLDAKFKPEALEEKGERE